MLRGKCLAESSSYASIKFLALFWDGLTFRTLGQLARLCHRPGFHHIGHVLGLVCIFFSAFIVMECLCL